MNVSEIVAAYGAYYENSGQNTSRVLSLLMQPEETEALATPIKTNDTIYRLGKATIGSILQPFQKSWTPKNALAVTPNELRMYKIKVDEDVYPDDIEATWLGFLASVDNDRKNWPLIRWMIENFYIPKIGSDYELYEVFKGEYADPVEGVAGAVGTCIDGLRKKIIDGINDATINSVELEDLTTSNIFDQVEIFDKAIRGAYTSTPMTICMSKTWERSYKEDKRATFGYQGNDLSGSVDFSVRTIKGLASMEGSNIIFATPKSNLISLSKKSMNMNTFGIESSKRQVSFYTDFWRGIDFGINAAVWAYIPESELGGSGSGSGAGV